MGGNGARRRNVHTRAAHTSQPQEVTGSHSSALGTERTINNIPCLSLPGASRPASNLAFAAFVSTADRHSREPARPEAKAGPMWPPNAISSLSCQANFPTTGSALASLARPGDWWRRGNETTPTGRPAERSARAVRTRPPPPSSVPLSPSSSLYLSHSGFTVCRVAHTSDQQADRPGRGLRTLTPTGASGSRGLATKTKRCCVSRSTFFKPSGTGPGPSKG